MSVFDIVIKDTYGGHFEKVNDSADDIWTSKISMSRR